MSVNIESKLEINLEKVFLLCYIRYIITFSEEK
jgi:hypothetical protein